jgi:hypothetical protein
MDEAIQTLERIRADCVSDRDTFASPNYHRPRFVDRAQKQIEAIEFALRILKGRPHGL